jgi:hypothetical protein
VTPGIGWRQRNVLGELVDGGAWRAGSKLGRWGSETARSILASLHRRHLVKVDARGVWRVTMAGIAADKRARERGLVRG